MDPSQYAELFLTESRDHLSTFNQLLLELERDPGAGEPVGGIFRAVHTIKGMAATMGYSKVADLAHRTENLLDLLRRGERVATAETIDLLFQSADALERSIAASVEGTEPDVDVRELSQAIDQAAKEFESVVDRPAKARPSVPVVAAPLGIGRTVRITLRPETPLKGARALLVLRRMQALGDVHAVEPAPIALESEDFDGRFAFRIESTASDGELDREIRAAGDVDELTIGTEDRKTPKAASGVGRARHVRVELSRLDSLMNLIGELTTARARLQELSGQRADPDLEDVAMKVARLSEELQTEIIQARMTPVWQVFDRFPRLVRDLARQLGKQVAFRVEGKEIELDRAILDEIGDPLVHLLRNAVDHGIESAAERREHGKPAEGEIVLSAVRERTTVAIRVSDDGGGIDRETILAGAAARGLVDTAGEGLSDEMLLRILARPGFSTARAVTDISGRGVGIDVVTARVQALGGTLEVSTERGVGTTFTLRLPTTVAIVGALITKVGDERYALPLTHVAETLDLDPRAVTQVDGREAMSLRDQVIPLVHLRRMLGVPGEPPVRRPVVVLQIGDQRSGLVVDHLVGQQEIVVKAFDPPRGALPIFSGATILGDGVPVLILDAGGLV